MEHEHQSSSEARAGLEARMASALIYQDSLEDRIREDAIPEPDHSNGSVWRISDYCLNIYFFNNLCLFYCRYNFVPDELKMTAKKNDTKAEKYLTQHVRVPRIQMFYLPP